MQAVETYLDFEAVSTAAENEIETPEEAAELEELKLLQKNAEKCGLEAMRDRAADRILAIAKTKTAKRLQVHLLTQEEFGNWCSWLPMAYSTLPASARTSSVHSWKRYAFDLVPLRVLEIVKRVREQNLFTELQIRTPEQNQVDPALFGRIGETWYLLARWAESAEHLLPLDELPHAVKIRLHPGVNIDTIFTGILFTLVSVGVGVIGVCIGGLFHSITRANNDQAQSYYTFYGFLIAFSISFVLSMYWIAKPHVKVWHLKKAHPIAAAAVAARG